MYESKGFNPIKSNGGGLVGRFILLLALFAAMILLAYRQPIRQWCQNIVSPLQYGDKAVK